MSFNRLKFASADISNDSNTEMENRWPSSLPRRRQTPRVARILKKTNAIEQEPGLFSQSAPQQNLPPHIPQIYAQVSDITKFLQNTQLPCVGRVINGHISFTLLPKMAKLYCPFNFAHSPGHRVVLVFNPTYTIPYVLNGTPSVYNGTEVDVTNQLADGENYLIVNTTTVPQEVMASIEWRDPNNAESIVNTIVTSREPMEVSPAMQIITDECPIGKKLIQTPGRGIQCQHCQCFDLTTFLEFAQATGDWKCPICGKMLSVDDLRYDPSFLKNCGALFLGDDFDEDLASTFF